ncbi:MAG: energy transducer TonB [Steroidobacterales bacterium]
MTSDELHRGLPPASDRLTTTLFLAALLHAIIILGVTFSAPREAGDGGETHGLEVVLVDNQAASAANPDAPYLAQRSQRGSGNTLVPERTLIPKSSPLAVMQAGSVNGDGAGTAGQRGQDIGDEARLASSAPSTHIVYFGTDIAADASPEQQLLLANVPTLGVNANDDGVELRMRGETRRELWVTADTRATDVAVYLDRWRRKVERIGTLNFPSVARRQKNSGTPIIAVTINSDGKLAQAVIRKTSGHRELDDAALRILKLAAPFDPFPPELNRTHNQIRIAYEWQFLGGAPAGSGISYLDAKAPADSQ